MAKNVKTKDYTGKDRRSQGFVGLLSPILIPAIVGLLCIGGYRWAVNDTMEKTRIHDTRIANLEKKCTEFGTALPYIKESIASIATSLHETQQDTKQILRELSKMERK